MILCSTIQVTNCDYWLLSDMPVQMSEKTGIVYGSFNWTEKRILKSICSKTTLVHNENILNK